MEEVKIMTTVYKAVDGREFLDKEKCVLWENILEEARCFEVLLRPDLTETGIYTEVLPVLVFSSHHCEDAIIRKYIETELRISPLTCGVQGYGWMESYRIRQSTVADFRKFAAKKKISDSRRYWASYQLVLTDSPDKIEMFFTGKGIDDKDCQVFNFKDRWNLK